MHFPSPLPPPENLAAIRASFAPIFVTISGERDKRRVFEDVLDHIPFPVDARPPS